MTMKKGREEETEEAAKQKEAGRGGNCHASTVTVGSWSEGIARRLQSHRGRLSSSNHLVRLDNMTLVELSGEQT